MSSSAAAFGPPIEPLLIAHRERLCSQLDNMRKNNVMCDVVVICKSTEFTAHKVVLSACSAFFHNMFTETVDRIEVSEVEPDTMETILTFMYMGHVMSLGESHVQPVLAAAHQLRVTHLYHYCRERIVATLSLDTLEHVWDLADLYSDPFLQGQSAQFAARNFKKLVRNGTFMELPAERLVALVGSDRLVAGHHDEVLAAVLNWVNCDRERRQRVLPDIIPHVQFDHLSAQYVNSLNGDPTVMDSLDLLQSLTKTMATRYQRSSGLQRNLGKAFGGAFGPDTTSFPSPFLGAHAENTNGERHPPPPPPHHHHHPHVGRPTAVFPFPAPVGVGTGAGGGRLLGGGGTAASATTGGLVPTGGMVVGGIAGGATGEPVLVVLGQDKEDSVILQHFTLYSRQWGNPYKAPVQKKFASIIAHKGLVYLIGGKIDLKPSSTVHICDVRTRKTRLVKDMNLPRCGMGVAELDGLIYVVGGYNKSGWLRDVECYDSVSDTWDVLASLQEGKEGVGVVAANGKVFAVGGVPVPTTEMYDPLSDQWTKLVRMRHARVYHGISVLEGLIYVVGGFGHYPDRIQCFDVDNSTWSVMTSRAPQQCRDTWCAAVPWNNHILVVNSEGLLWDFDAAHESWSKLPSSFSLVGGYISGFVSATILDMPYR